MSIRENTVLTGALALVMVGAYLSWHHEPEVPGNTTVALFDHAPEAVESVELVSPTATVAVSFFEHAGERRAWFEVSRRGKTRSFVGNEAFDKQLDQYAKLTAARSLGRVDAETLSSMKLDAPDRALTLRANGKTERLELGGRTSGARDFYARRPGDAEVFLIRSPVIVELESPEGRYMQRRARAAPANEVARLKLEVAGQTMEAIHKNRLSPRDAYWARGDAPDAVDEALGNYIQKLERLSAIEFVEDPDAFEAATPVLKAVWLDEDGDPLDALELRKTAGETPKWLALSNALGRPAEVPRATAEQLEADVDVVLGR